MEPAMRIDLMRLALYKAAVEGKPEDYYNALGQAATGEDDGLHVVMPNGNTVLHVAALHGRQHFVEHILQQGRDNGATLSLLFAQSKENESVLHFAAETGHANIVSFLIMKSKDVESGIGAMRMMIQMTDNVMDTALHKAVRMGHLEVVKLLVEEDVEFVYPPNIAGERPIYIAAKSGFRDCLQQLLDTCKYPTYGGPLGQNALHATVFHIAARHGNIKTMKYISNSFPDCWTMINCKSQNVLHEAILSGRVNMIKYILKDPHIDNLVDQKDKDGNTPLHLLGIISNCSIVDCNHIERRLKRKHYLLVNKRHQTPDDLFSQPNYAFKHISGGIPHRSGRRNGPRADLQENEETKADTDNVDEEEEINRMLQISKTMTIVATLILTITFAAGFTVPGGYDANSGSKQGKPILLENSAFKYFVYFDSISFVCSILSILIYIRMVVEASSSSRKYTTIVSLCYLETVMIVYASLGVVATFFSGLYATIEPLSRAIAALFIGLVFPLTVALCGFCILKSLKYKLRFL